MRMCVWGGVGMDVECVSGYGCVCGCGCVDVNVGVRASGCVWVWMWTCECVWVDVCVDRWEIVLECKTPQSIPHAGQLF